MKSTAVYLLGLGGWALLGAGLLAARPAAPEDAPARLGRVSAPPKKPVGARRLLTGAAAQGFWRQHDLAPLWRMDVRQGSRPLPGFFGQEGFKIEFALLQVQRVAGQPHVYRVDGKSRCLKNVAVPFSGAIVLRQVYRGPTEDGQPTYTIVGSFEFTEARIAPNTGTFRGTVATDLTPLEGGQFSFARVEGSPANACGYKFDGQWRSTGGEVERVVWAAQWRTLARQLFDDFEVGDRMPAISRKYADRGWNNYWENDEWWTDSPGAGGLTL